VLEEMKEHDVPDQSETSSDLKGTVPDHENITAESSDGEQKNSGDINRDKANNNPSHTEEISNK
jgi:hypothetical protein